jgi:hypothetical protein
LINTDVKTEMNNLRAENAKLKAAKPTGRKPGTNGAKTKEPTPRTFNQELARPEVNEKNAASRTGKNWIRVQSILNIAYCTPMSNPLAHPVRRA